MSRDIFALDLETAARDKRVAQYGGLEPWRLWKKTVHVTSATLCRPDNSVWSIHRRLMGDVPFDLAFADMVDSVAGKITYCHNATFDVAWSIGSFKERRTDNVPQRIRDVKWHDTLLLAKWVINGQRADDMAFSLALANLIKTMLHDHPLCEEYVRMKAEKVDPSMDPYWERRNQLDAIMTRQLAVFLEEKLPDTCRNGYSTEMRNIVPAANSWLMGIRIDQDRLGEVEKKFVAEQREILKEIEIAPEVLTSPKQLGNLLFNQLKLTPVSWTPTGSPSSRADDIKVIAHRLITGGNEELGKVLSKIIRYKQLATLRSKYVDGAKAALEHTEDGFIYGAPRIFGTYTGRYTYSSKTLDTWQTGIALHQIPRKDKDVRSFLVPPEGMKVHEDDAKAQESRLMAIRSGDPTMIQVFNNGLDLHSMTASFIVGIDYDELVKAYQAGEPKAIENRQFGKLTNLSGNFRIGAQALSRKAFEEYDLILGPDKTWYFLDVMKKRYRGIPMYWDESIKLAKAVGYAQTFGGRRYKIHDWSGERTWQSESSALMFPIQGGGADMKDIAVAETYEKVPDAQFCLDLHDASFFWVPDDGKCEEICTAVDETLNTVNYERYWGFVPQVKLPYDSKTGDSLADVK